MTKLQHDLLLFQLWPAACDYQGWPSRVREAKRREVTAQVFEGGKSWKDINKTNEFDRIKTRLEELAGKVVVDTNGDRKRLLHRIAELDGEGREQLANWDAYINPILKERFGIVPGVRSVTDLANKDLLDLSRTLTNRIAGLQRRDAESAKVAETENEPF